jgi:hypothetical protein
MGVSVQTPSYVVNFILSWLMDTVRLRTVHGVELRVLNDGYNTIEDVGDAKMSSDTVQLTNSLQKLVLLPPVHTVFFKGHRVSPTEPIDKVFSSESPSSLSCLTL